MRSVLSVAVACLVVSLSPFLSSGAAAVPVVIDTDTYGGHTYYLLSLSTWLEAEAAAVGLGGHLVTIESAEENAWVAGRFAVQRDLWIGFSDAAIEGTYSWASGVPFGYQNWAPGEPNDCSFGTCLSEDFGQMFQDYGGGSHGKWNDLGNDYALNGVVEAVPEPSSLALLGLGAVTLVGGRRRGGRVVGRR
jgi:hypothetical protein